MISFNSWLEKRINEDAYRQFDSQKQASVAQALASGGERPNVGVVVKGVLNDPKLKAVASRMSGVKLDQEKLNKDVAAEIQKRNKPQAKTTINAGGGAI
jgi:hypothetical protein